MSLVWDPIKGLQEVSHMLPEYDDNDVWGDYDYIYGILYKHLRPELDALMENMFANGDSVDKVYSGLLDLISYRSDNAQYLRR